MIKTRPYEVVNEFCCYCKINMNDLPEGVTYTKDHLVPKCKGGNDSMYNKVTCCSDCNTEKGSRNIKQYIAFLTKEFNKLKQCSSDSNIQLMCIIALKISNAEYYKNYIEVSGLKLYKNKIVYDQWKDH